MLVCVEISFVRNGEEKARERAWKCKSLVSVEEYAVLVIVATAVMIGPACVMTAMRGLFLEVRRTAVPAPYLPKACLLQEAF